MTHPRRFREPFFAPQVIVDMIGGISLQRPVLQQLHQQRGRLALGAALLTHVAGLVGMLWVDRPLFLAATPLNLILMAALVVWTFEGSRRSLLQFFGIAFGVGMVAEIIGVNTGLLFGEYAYGKVLGIGVAGVPFVIGLNWFAVVWGAASLSGYILPVPDSRRGRRLYNKTTQAILFVVVTSFLALGFDVLLEPAAVQLGFWAWSGGDIPFFNYACWLAISAGLALVLHRMGMRTSHRFAIQLFLIEALFFFLIRTLG